METPYEQMLAILEAARDALPQAQAPVMPSEITQWTRQLPFSDIRRANVACERFADTRQWPVMTNEVLAQMHLRVEAAIDLCRGMLRLQKPPMPFPPDEALRSLLVHYWHNHGPEWVAWRYGGEPPLPTMEDPTKN